MTPREIKPKWYDWGMTPREIKPKWYDWGMTPREIKPKWYDWGMTNSIPLNSKKRGGMPHSKKTKLGLFFVFGALPQSPIGKDEIIQQKKIKKKGLKRK